MKDAVETMGAVLPDEAGGRDAVHVAVFSAFSMRDLSPGERLAIVRKNETDTEVTSVTTDEVAIADPFISGTIPAGNRFWAYLMPRTITALSHRWSHPSFETTASVYTPPSQKLIAEEWIRDYIKSEEWLENFAEGGDGDWLDVPSYVNSGIISPQ